jgi:hypothetical protein
MINTLELAARKNYVWKLKTFRTFTLVRKYNWSSS